MENPLVVDHMPLLGDVAGGIGDPQVRNWGTIGGSCAHADPSSDWPAALIATRASLVCRSTAGERVIAARDFFLDTFTTAIEPTEVLTEIGLARRARSSGAAYVKLERRAGDFATVGVAALVRLGGDGRITGAGIALTAVAETPFAATDAEAALAGREPSAAQSRPVSDSHGPAGYKRAMVAEVTVRALRAAVDRARAYA
jgi:carbon-monoxide dehydrogenase medium subunit